jgi:hypothetical protein
MRSEQYGQSDAYSLIVYAIRSQITCDYYLRRPKIFFNYINLLPKGTIEESISINFDDNLLEIEAQSETRDYYHIINLPSEEDAKSWKYGSLNGLVEITVQKGNKKKSK